MPKVRICVSAKMRLRLNLLVYPSVFRYFGGRKEKLEVCSCKSGGQSFTATKAADRPAHGKQASHFSIR